MIGVHVDTGAGTGTENGVGRGSETGAETGSAQIMDGLALATKVKAEATQKVAEVKAGGSEVGLAVILVGDDPASASYVKMKAKDCIDCGITAYDHKVPGDISQDELHEIIDAYNSDPRVHGILVQMPVPAHLDPEKIISRISPQKDVDGFHPQNLGALVRGTEGFKSCTPWGVMRLFQEYGISLEGKNAVVVGRSTIVGKPMALMMLQENATVTVAHSKTKDLVEVCSRADILVVACGRPQMITGAYVKPGAVVVDVGINRTEEGTLVGDVLTEEAALKASFITPVPGGVGPMTRAILMDNTAQAALNAQ